MTNPASGEDEVPLPHSDTLDAAARVVIQRHAQRDARFAALAATATAGTPTPLVLMSTRLWLRWSGIAIGHLADARSARLAGEAAQTRHEDVSDFINLEFDAALQSIAAAAHAFEGFHQSLRGVVAVQDATVHAWIRKQTAAYKQLIQRARLGFEVGKQADRWQAELKWLKGRRVNAVHHRELARPTRHHPLGVDVSDEVFEYRWESAERAVDLLLHVTATCVQHPKPETRAFAEQVTGAVEGLTEQRRALAT